MRILIVGGCHVYGHGLALNQLSFIDLFTQQLDSIGHYTDVTSYVFLPLDKIAETITQLHLSEYDLIILQPAHYQLQHPASFWTLFKTPKHTTCAKQSSCAQPADNDKLRRQFVGAVELQATNFLKVLKNNLKCLLLRAGHQIRLVKQLHFVEHEIENLLIELQPYRHKILLLTPVPHREIVSQWLRKQGRKLFRDIGNRHGVTVLDTHLLIKPQKEFYLPNDSGHLNGAGHELIGRELINCFLSKNPITYSLLYSRE